MPLAIQLLTRRVPHASCPAPIIITWELLFLSVLHQKSLLSCFFKVIAGQPPETSTHHEGHQSPARPLLLHGGLQHPLLWCAACTSTCIM